MKQITEENPGRTFVHLCPLCKNWQVDYTEHVFLLNATMTVDDETEEFSYDLSACHEMIEDVVAEHFEEAHPGESVR